MRSWGKEQKKVVDGEEVGSWFFVLSSWLLVLIFEQNQTI